MTSSPMRWGKGHRYRHNDKDWSKRTPLEMTEQTWGASESAILALAMTATRSPSAQTQDAAPLRTHRKGAGVPRPP
eukprot:scaffold104454_cov28-Tisochrysis_lutea.AAC.5